jgi:quercetin dioxygenase-like cupin family protein
MSLPSTTQGYGLAPDEGEGLWFNGALNVLKATGEQTEGRFVVLEQFAPGGFAAPLHVHGAEDELFFVLSGEVRFQIGEEIIEAIAGSFIYAPREVKHSYRVDSSEARLLLFFGPAGCEGFFREGGKPARSLVIPSRDEKRPGLAELTQIAARYLMKIVGPPLEPRK